MKKEKKIRLQSLASLLLIFIGLAYALHIADGYIKGQREYASPRDEYTSLYAK